MVLAHLTAYLGPFFHPARPPAPLAADSTGMIGNVLKTLVERGQGHLHATGALRRHRGPAGRHHWQSARLGPHATVDAAIQGSRPGQSCGPTSSAATPDRWRATPMSPRCSSQRAPGVPFDNIAIC
jgi:hypothetical protein